MPEEPRGHACLIVAAALVALLSADSSAEPPLVEPVRAATVEIAAPDQEILELPVRVVDDAGQPIAGANIKPWAFRSAEGHILWRQGSKAIQVDPKQVTTLATGMAEILYPRYSNIEEQIRTIQVSLVVDHPDFVFLGVHVDVPLAGDDPYEIKLPAGAPPEVRALLDGEPADLDDVFLLSSGAHPSGAAKLGDGVFRIPPLSEGANSVLLVKLDGECATHFSPIVDIEIAGNEPQHIDVPLVPAVRIEGMLGDAVPRPVRAGRIKVRTLPPTADYRRVSWSTWVPVRRDGSFTIESWPAGERLQLTALCKGFIATNGVAPDCVDNPRDPARDRHLRAQVFDPNPTETIVVPMTPLIPCRVTTIAEDEKPVAGISVRCGPNVGWWNGGSAIYGFPLFRPERSLRGTDNRDRIDDELPHPFRAETDTAGQATLYLPVGRRRLTARSEAYQLPTFRGHRERYVRVVPGEKNDVVLRLQPRGTDKPAADP